MVCMESLFYKKLKEHLEALKPPISVTKALALAIIPTGQGSNWKNCKRKPTESEINALSSVKALSLTTEKLNSWKILDDYSESGIKSAALEIEPDPIIPHTMPKGTYRIPCLGTVTAGSLAMVEDVEDIVYYGFDHPKCKTTKLFCLKVLGDSMEPKIPNGAIVLVEQVNTFQNGALYVVLTDDGKSTMKIVSMSQDGLQLIPINKRHKPIDVKGFEIDKIFEVIEYKVRFKRCG